MGDWTKVFECQMERKRAAYRYDDTTPRYTHHSESVASILKVLDENNVGTDLSPLYERNTKNWYVVVVNEEREKKRNTRYIYISTHLIEVTTLTKLFWLQGS